VPAYLASALPIVRSGDFGMSTFETAHRQVAWPCIPTWGVRREEQEESRN